MLKKSLLFLKPYDITVIVFFTFLTLLNIIFNQRIENWHILAGVNIWIIIITYGIAYSDFKQRNIFWNFIHYLYIAPIILITFKELYFLIQPIRPFDYDWMFIEIDRFLFGGDPTVFLYQFANPFFTELLQIVYGIFYMLPMILAIDLIRKKRFLDADYAIFATIYGFYLSYLGYFAFPAVGPRFTLHDFHSINLELPGLFLTEFLREFTNTGESIPAGTPNPITVVQRDVFPSGHTMITLIVMYLSVRQNSKTKCFILPVGILLIFSTVYLRYHYVIDVIGGLVFAIISIWSGKFLFNWWQKKTNKPEFEYTR